MPNTPSSDGILRRGTGRYGFFTNLDVDNLNFNGNVISSATGTVSFDDDDITTGGRIIATGAGETGKLLTGLAGVTVVSYTGDSLDIRAGEGNTSAQNVLRVTSAGNFDFYDGNITTTGTLTSNTIHIIGSTFPSIDYTRGGVTRGQTGISGGDFVFDAITNDFVVRLNNVLKLTVSSTAVTSTGEIINPKAKMTLIGGYAVLLTNKTGSNTVAGQIVKASTTTDDAFILVGVNGTNPIGIVLETGVSDGSEAWIVVSGIADVLVDAGGCARGDRLITGAIGGFATVNNAPAVAVHFQEIGHCIETRAGAGLARCISHFN